MELVRILKSGTVRHFFQPMSELVQKFDPYHDEHGRFTSKDHVAVRDKYKEIAKKYHGAEEFARVASGVRGMLVNKSNIVNHQHYVGADFVKRQVVKVLKVSHQHEFASSAIAEKNLASVQKMYAHLPGVSVEQQNSRIKVSGVFNQKHKPEYEKLPAMNKAKEEVQDIYGHPVDVLEENKGGGKLHVEHEHQFEDQAAAERALPRVKAAYKQVAFNARVNVDGANVNARMTLEPKAKPAPVRPPLKIAEVPVAKPAEAPFVPIPLEGAEEHLKTAKIVLNHPLIENRGVNKTRVITFEDGSKAIWKPHEEGIKDIHARVKDGFQTEREVGAWQVAKAVGMQDLLAPAVERSIDGKRGSILAFVKGEVASNVRGDKKYDGEHDSARAAAFDYVIGNLDRHGGNWLVDTSENPEGKLRLIDHGYAFPDGGEALKHIKPFGNHLMVHNQKSKMPGIMDDWEEFGSIPEHAKEPFVTNKDKVLQAMMDSGLPQASIKQVDGRIDHLATAKKWKDLN